MNQWSVSALLPGKEPPLLPIQWIGDWVDARTGLDAVGKRKIPTPNGN